MFENIGKIHIDVLDDNINQIHLLKKCLVIHRFISMLLNSFAKRVG